jgi:putative heme-binding domain-containing protein
VQEWAAKATAEADTTAGLTALLALARYGDRSTQAGLLAALEKFPLSKLPDAQKLEKLRVLGVSFIRQGRPTAEQTRKVIAEIDPLFPSANEFVNREAAIVLIYLNAPSALPKCLKLMADAKTQEDRYHYLFHLRTLPIGYWTLDQRKEYLGYYTKDRGKMAHPPEVLKWFADAGRPYGDGNSYANFMRNFLREFVSNLSDAEKTALAGEIAAIDKTVNAVVQAKPWAFVKKWTMDEMMPLLAQVEKGRDFEKGKQAFADAHCAKCHRLGDVGGAVGPDLTAVSARFDRRAILESIIEPSKVLSDQYQNETFASADGKSVTGRVVDETKDELFIQADPLDPKRVAIKKVDLDSRKPSPVSPMPADLANGLTKDEVLDLIAYLEAGGRKDYKAFRK